MVQPEHPPRELAQPLDLARASGLIPVNQPPVHKLSRWGFVHYGQGSSVRSPILTNVVLGNRYSSVELETMCNGIDGWVETPAQREVMDLMQMDPLQRRMNYRAYLEQALDHAEPNSKREIGLQLEKRLWRMFDYAEMQDKLDRGLEWPLKNTLDAQNEHWRWMLPLVRGHATPTTPSWRGMKHVPVHRLLWCMVYPLRPFKSNPQREDWCIETMCVNPTHFYDPSTRPKQSYEGPGRGYEYDIPTGTRIKWTITDVVVLPDGTRGIKCPECEALTRDKRCLELVNDPFGPPAKGSTMYCWSCYQIHRRRTRGLGPRPARLPDKHRLVTKAERQEQEFIDAQRRETSPLRFDWDNDWSDGTSTVDMRPDGPVKPW